MGLRRMSQTPHKILILCVSLAIPFLLLHGLNTYGLVSQDQMSQDLILYLPITEGEGRVVHDQIGNGDANIFGANWYHSENFIALEFDGVSSYATITSPPQINNDLFSISVFVNYYTIDEGWSNCIITQDDDSSNGGHFGFQLSHNEGNVWWWAATSELRSIIRVEMNYWYHIVLSFDGSYYKMWMNGVFQGQQEGPPLAIDESEINIGRKNPEESYFYFNGLIDELKIFNRVITNQEIQDLYQLGNGWVDTKVTTTTLSFSTPFSFRPLLLFVPVVITSVGLVYYFRMRFKENKSLE